MILLAASSGGYVTAVLSLIGAALLGTIGFGVRMITKRIDELTQELRDAQRHTDKLSTSLLMMTFRIDQIEDLHPAIRRHPHRHPGGEAA